MLELSLPEDVNIFYALDLRGTAPVELVVRRKMTHSSMPPEKT